MKRTVLDTDLQRSDIRPPSLIRNFREVSRVSSLEFFGDESELDTVRCPACDTDKVIPVFKKEEYTYNMCLECGSLFVSPRPRAELLRNYYLHSRAGLARVNYFNDSTADARFVHVLQSRVDWVQRIIGTRLNGKSYTYADVGTVYTRFLDEIVAANRFDAVLSLDAHPEVSKRLAKGIRSEALADVTQKLDVVSCFEHLEHQYSPYSLLKQIYDRLVPGGTCFLTTRTSSGLDMLTLWSATPYIFVPEHLNLLSIEGLYALCDRVGFEVVELSTPGQLDVQLMRDAAAQDPAIKLPRFLDYMIQHRQADTIKEFQLFLQKNRLSSHVRIALVKPAMA